MESTTSDDAQQASSRTPAGTDPTSSPHLSIPDSLAAEYGVSIRDYLRDNNLDFLIAAAVVFDQAGRLLLIQRASGDWVPDKWEVPGGTAEPDRDGSVLTAAARELLEETGLRPTAVTRHVHTFTFVHKGQRWQKVTFEFEVECEREHEHAMGRARGRATTQTAAAALTLTQTQTQAQTQKTEKEVEAADAAATVKASHGFGLGVGLVVLDPAEHQDFAWVSEEEYRAGWASGGRKLVITHPNQEETLDIAFKLRRERA